MDNLISKRQNVYVTVKKKCLSVKKIGEGVQRKVRRQPRRNASVFKNTVFFYSTPNACW